LYYWKYGSNHLVLNESFRGMCWDRDYAAHKYNTAVVVFHIEDK